MNLPLVSSRHSKRALLAICFLCAILFFSSSLRRTPLQVEYTWLLGGNKLPLFSSTEVTLISSWESLDSLKSCSENPTDPVGAIEVDRTELSWTELRTKYIKLAQVPDQTHSKPRSNGTLRTWQYVHNFSQSGASTLGLWSPIECRPRQTVAVIIPYRDRDGHLRIFLNHMHTLLRHQQLLYAIFVIEQVGKTIFNRAALFNIGFLESYRLAEFDCFIFHDVDLLPQDDRLPYRCRDQPVHFSVAVDRYDYRLPYETIFGGAIAMTRDQFKHVRGFSNCYFGWGGEDDDMYIRVRQYGYQIFRHSPSIARYATLTHTRDALNQPNPARHKLLANSKKRLTIDGYPETEYKVVSAKPSHGGLAYWISVDLAEDRIRHRFNLTNI